MLSKFTDKEGRFVLVNGSICGVTVSLLNMYTPNDNNSKFFKRVGELILEKATRIILIRGDFNCVMSDRLDKNPSSFATPSGATRSLKQMTEDLGLINAWRHIHPRERD